MANHYDGADRDIDTVVVGTEVFGSDGGKVGVVGEVGSDYLVVERGILSTRKIRVPLSDVDRVDRGGVIHLRNPMSQVTAREA